MCVFTAVKAKAEASGPGVRMARAGWPSDWKAEAFLPPMVKGKLGSSGTYIPGLAMCW